MMIQVAQICASLMDPDEFVATLLFRHGAADEPLVRERMYSEVLLGGYQKHSGARGLEGHGRNLGKVPERKVPAYIGFN